MKKADLTIERIYEYSFDKESYTLSTKIYKVIKETNSNVSLENGQKIKGSDIYDFYKTNSTYETFVNQLIYKSYIYTILPITKAMKIEFIEMVKQTIDNDIKVYEFRLKSANQTIENTKEKISEYTDRILKLKSQLAKLTSK